MKIEKIRKKHLFEFLTVFGVLIFASMAFGFVEKRDDKVYIVDRTGVSWDVTQAVSLGFKPSRFQYGIGKHAFTPLDESHVKDAPDRIQPQERVIGVKKEGRAHAYSVNRLRHHEIANTRIGGRPIAAGY